MGRVRAALLGLCATLATAGSQAGLVSTVTTDTPTQLEVSWTWDPEAPGSSTPALDHWFATLTIAGPVDDRWSLGAEFRHRTDPHPELGESGGGQSYYVSVLSFDDAGDFGVLFDDPRMYAYHSPLNRVHTDVFHFTLFRGSDPADTLIRLAATHVPRILPAPEPGTLALVGLGLAGLAASRRRAPRPLESATASSERARGARSP